jgi:hypothetical protein
MRDIETDKVFLFEQSGQIKREHSSLEMQSYEEFEKTVLLAFVVVVLCAVMGMLTTEIKSNLKWALMPTEALLAVISALNCLVPAQHKPGKLHKLQQDLNLRNRLFREHETLLDTLRSMQNTPTTLALRARIAQAFQTASPSELKELMEVMALIIPSEGWSVDTQLNLIRQHISANGKHEFSIRLLDEVFQILYVQELRQPVDRSSAEN